ncbi:MAG: pyridoxamine kinase [Peptococcia bacterium]
MNRNRPVKRVAAINDLSGFGRSSLAVTIPILSTMGIQVCSVPTAVLSTHTGDFPGYSFIDLTDSMEKFLVHWQQLELEFEAIYSGFLGSPRQGEIVSRFIESFARKDTLVVVDPVMGDDGKLYATMDQQMVQAMKELIKKANVITPNITEAALLLDEEFHTAMTEKELRSWLIRLADMGPDVVIITGIPDPKQEKNTMVLAYNRTDNRFWKVSCVYIPANFPGTGDIFTSVIVGSLLQGDSLPVAIDRGVQFITVAIRASYGFNYPLREGVILERVLANLNMPVIANTYDLLDIDDK